jgi:hypothetical protein
MVLCGRLGTVTTVKNSVSKVGWLKCFRNLRVGLVGLHRRSEQDFMPLVFPLQAILVKNNWKITHVIIWLKRKIELRLTLGVNAFPYCVKE